MDALLIAVIEGLDALRFFFKYCIVGGGGSNGHTQQSIMISLYIVEVPCYYIVVQR